MRRRFFCSTDSPRRGCSRLFSPASPTAIISSHPITGGFGHSDWPDPGGFAYACDPYAEIMNHFPEEVGLSRHTLYTQDHGGPVGFHMALAHPDWIAAPLADRGHTAAVPMTGIQRRGGEPRVAGVLPGVVGVRSRRP